MLLVSTLLFYVVSSTTTTHGQQSQIRVTKSSHDYITASSGCGQTTPVPPGNTTKQTITIDDPIAGSLERVYLLHLPSTYNSSVPHHFIIDLHGYYMDGATEEKQDHLSMISDSADLIIVYPYGSNDSASSLYGWNGVGTSANYGRLGYTCNTDRLKWGEYECYDSCAEYNCQSIDTCFCSSCWNDTLFILEMMNLFESTLCINLNSIHATGISNGAMMNYQLGQSLSYIFASMVPIAGSCLLGYNKELSPRGYPISLMDWHGHGDKIVPSNISNSYDYPKYIGPYNSTFSSDGFYYTPSLNITRLYAEVNECDGYDDTGRQHYPTPYDGRRNLYCWKPFGNCKYGTDVVECVGDWGHDWPLHDRDNSAYPIIVWDFIRTHPKQNVTWKQGEEE